MTGKLFSVCAICLASFVMGILIQPAAAVVMRTVALTGDAAPDTATGVTYTKYFSLPSLNASGQVAFKGVLEGPGISNTNWLGIWSEGSGALSLVARSGEAAPDTAAGTTFSGFGPPTLNDSGQIAFTGYLAGDDIEDFRNDTGFWSTGPGPLTLVARSDDTPPGADPDSVYAAFYGINPLFNNAGQIAFRGGYQPLNVGYPLVGVWTERPGSLDLVARSNQPAHGTEPGVAYAYISEPKFNDAGQTLYTAELSGPGVDGSNLIGLWLDTAGSTSLLVRTGDAAVGTGPGVVFDRLTSSGRNYGLALNHAGQVAFGGQVVGAGVTPFNNQGLWSGTPDALGLVVRKGDAAPGIAGGLVFGDLGAFDLNDAGRIVFTGVLTTQDTFPSYDDGGIWIETQGGIHLLARDGEAAPGTGTDAEFTQLYRSRPMINQGGQIAFFGLLRGTSIDATNNSGVWATDPGGQLTLIARTGDLFDVNDDPLIDDLRTIRSINQLPGVSLDAVPSPAINDAGQLAFYLSFTDGSEGIFVATIPEPGTLGLLGVGAGLVIGRRGKRLS